MAKPTASATSGNTHLRDRETLEKIRWSLRQRLCEHMRRLNTDLFDEVDDFLFHSVQPDELAEGSTQLKLVREFRNKKQLFEEKFLASIDGALQSTLVPGSSNRKISARVADEKTVSSAYEKMEVDLALERMQRKAFKFYAARIRELGDSEREAEEHDASRQLLPENRDFLIRNTLRALAGSQRVFRVSLDSRLVFLKLFEQHFLLKMDRLYQDVISIINNQANRKFVERLYASSTSIHQRRNRTQPPDKAKDAGSSPEAEALSVSQRITEKVTDLIEAWCGTANLPDFVEAMLREDWQNVMFLMGLNKGVETREWCEARETAELLLKLATGNPAEEKVDANQLVARLRQGFDLSQTERESQDTFFNGLGELLEKRRSESREQPADSSGNEPNRKIEVASSNYAAVSEAGRKILDNRDLDDFIALLSDDQEQAIAEVEEEAISMDYYLNMVDAMADDVSAQLKSAERELRCTIQKSTSIPDSYQVLDETGQVLLTRGRVGLAVSLRAGEIRLDGQEDFGAAYSAGPRSSSAARNTTGHRTTH
ncbi:MAG: DUF1631 family protein [Gammaproteobacteria bacterium]|nr:DUF1631 family protein [Pseudomonadales bacterium]MCP5345590.1 DUF1631 family protein [Pseudomonadales bacterium]